MSVITREELKERNLESELHYSMSRSSGPGGQNVNKVNTRVELRFNVGAALLLTEEEKELIFIKLKNRINKVGELVLSAQANRSMLKNKESVTERFYTLLATALSVSKPRRPTRPTLASKTRRLTSKKNKSVLKQLRRNQGEA